MSIEKPDNERLALYQRFKESLAKGETADADYFDADDLIVIIDQAVDLNDEYVEIEALMRGYRYFPDNEELRSRKAFLFYELNLDDGVDNMRQQMPEDSPMSKILMLRRMDGTVDPQSVEPVLDSIAGTPGKLDDETIIQLVDCASACECYDWLKNNEPKLRKKTDYLPTLLYELFIVADMRHDRDYCIKLLEELTELEPFNVDFWNALAQVLVNIGDDPEPNEPDFEGALSTLEYALAIDSVNPAALTLKASILIELDRPAEAVETLSGFENDMKSPSMADIYIRAVYLTGQIDKATTLIGKYLRRYPDSEEIFHLLVSVNSTANLDELVAIHFQALSKAPDAIEKWAERAREYYNRGELIQAKIMLETIYNYDQLDANTTKLYMTCLYCLGLYDQCIERFEDMTRRPSPRISPTVIIAGIMSYLKKGDKRMAKAAFKNVKELFPLHISESWVLSSALEAYGMAQFMHAVDTMLNQRGPIKADELDIFQFPNSPSPEQ